MPTTEEAIIVHGSGVLSGRVQVSGAKNSALKLMPASLLGQGLTTLHNVPLISDIDVMADVLRHLGATVVQDGHDMTVDTTSLKKYETPYELVSKMRASISVLGPLIGRFGRARVAMPGGCRIGARKIDLHLAGLQQLTAAGLVKTVRGRGGMSLGRAADSITLLEIFRAVDAIEDGALFSMHPNPSTDSSCPVLSFLYCIDVLPSHNPKTRELYSIDRKSVV